CSFPEIKIQKVLIPRDKKKVLISRDKNPTSAHYKTKKHKNSKTKSITILKK
ncbi:hypothetical protein M153_95400001, partial [Pseudoloma neurophilia]